MRFSLPRNAGKRFLATRKPAASALCIMRGTCSGVIVLICWLAFAAAEPSRLHGTNATDEGVAERLSVMSWFVGELHFIAPLWLAMTFTALVGCELGPKKAPKDGRPWSAIGVSR